MTQRPYWSGQVRDQRGSSCLGRNGSLGQSGGCSSDRMESLWQEGGRGQKGFLLLRARRLPGPCPESGKAVVIERWDLCKRKPRACLGGSRSGSLALFLRLVPRRLRLLTSTFLRRNRADRNRAGLHVLCGRRGQPRASSMASSSYQETASCPRPEKIGSLRTPIRAIASRAYSQWGSSCLRPTHDASDEAYQVASLAEVRKRLQKRRQATDTRSKENQVSPTPLSRKNAGLGASRALPLETPARESSATPFGRGVRGDLPSQGKGSHGLRNSRCTESVQDKGNIFAGK